jgi:hypothetical protein
MPVQKKGFLFEHFEKIICGVVALCVLVSAVLALRRANALQRQAPSGPLKEMETRVTQAWNHPARPLPVPSYLAGILKQETVPPPLTMSRDVTQPLLPVRLPLVRVAPGKEIILRFPRPLDRDSVPEKDAAGLLVRRVHPVGDDFSAVLVETGTTDGQTTIVGTVGQDTYEYPIVIDKQVGKVAHPPTAINVVSGGRQVVLRLMPNPLNDQESVLVVVYEIWRRDWNDPLGEYHKVGEVEPGQTVTPTASPAGAGRGYGEYGAEVMEPGGPYGPAVAPGGLPRAPAKPNYTEWVDYGVAAGQPYSFKARSVGENTYPAAGEYTEPIMVRADPDVDFMFSRSGLDKVGFDVISLIPGGYVARGSFWVGVGQEIGGVVADSATGRVVSLQTQATLVDFHRAVLLPGVGVTDRVIYADKDGSLKTRLRSQQVSGLWKAAARTGPAAQPGRYSGFVMP